MGNVVKDFGNGYKIHEVFAKKEMEGYGYVFSTLERFRKAYPEEEPLKGYAVCDKKGLLPPDCTDLHSIISDAVRDYEELVVPVLLRNKMNEKTQYRLDEIPEGFVPPERLFLCGVEEVNVQLQDGRYFHMHESMSEDGYDWTLYTSDFRIVDGGIYDDPDVSLEEVYDILAEEYGFDNMSVQHMEEEFEENMVIPQREKWADWDVDLIDKLDNMHGSEISPEVAAYINGDKEVFQKVEKEVQRLLPEYDKKFLFESWDDLYNCDAIYMKAIQNVLGDKVTDVECGYGMIEMRERNLSLDEKMEQASSKTGQKEKQVVTKEMERE